MPPEHPNAEDFDHFRSTHPELRMYVCVCQCSISLHINSLTHTHTHRVPCSTLWTDSAVRSTLNDLVVDLVNRSDAGYFTSLQDATEASEMQHSVSLSAPPIYSYAGRGGARYGSMANVKHKSSVSCCGSTT